MKKGMVFTLDATGALVLVIMLMFTFVYVLSYYSQMDDSSLRLSRLARDGLELQHQDSTVSLPSYVVWGSSCANAEDVGSATMLVYGDITQSGRASVATSTQVVCFAS